ncbi:phosphate ABC transporter permease subunit PstC [Aporhodopirellula aestuarii]|uniref:Phosphate transport system permease protein n=1 Tax=Aporhodopirellula aestuarii TaxID=2950107 RepID=A0ABT0U4V7_9BACT|nr:phosphate ABC transporter permease subunit PstC [Aporhodopirellula aestuarii]MCM2371960.1 phosphate ABC transporter permease subunit PstC [Aporhodopirellula aestuarii]
MSRPAALENRQFRSTGAGVLQERLMVAVLAMCALATVGITVGIIVMLVGQSWNFFNSEHVSFKEFFTGTEWTALQSKNIDDAKFGILPLLSGTFRVTAIAMLIALPSGLITAVYLSEFASKKVRAVLKPTLEVIAGIPTVVLGYFAVLVIGPSLQWLTDGGFDAFNATSAGIAVGILCLPMVCSLSEDALHAVPRALREGAYGLGCTPFETSVKVVIPAALSGIVSAFLLAFSRAVGETMVVALAAGTQATYTMDPRTQSQTMTGFIVEMIKSENEYGTVQYFSLYGVAIALFVITFGMTLIGQLVRRRYRESYS